jgi:hypothetical protein
MIALGTLAEVFFAMPPAVIPFTQTFTHFMIIYATVVLLLLSLVRLPTWCESVKTSHAWWRVCRWMSIRLSSKASYADTVVPDPERAHTALQYQHYESAAYTSTSFPAMPEEGKHDGGKQSGRSGWGKTLQNYFRFMPQSSIAVTANDTLKSKTEGYTRCNGGQSRSDDKPQPAKLQQQLGREKKRPRLGGFQESEGDGDEVGPKKRKADELVTSKARPIRKLACPFFKRNPQLYQNCRTCPGPGWDDVHRIK